MSIYVRMATVILVASGLSSGCHQPDKKPAAAPHANANSPGTAPIAPAADVASTGLAAAPSTSADASGLESRVAASRAAYLSQLLTLRDFYEANGLDAKRKWAEAELEGLRRVKTYNYGGESRAAK